VAGRDKFFLKFSLVDNSAGCLLQEEICFRFAPSWSGDFDSNPTWSTLFLKMNIFTYMVYGCSIKSKV